jgi:SAM-dependent methyltransferase
MEPKSVVEQPQSGPGGGAGDEVRAHLHAMWAAVAGSWGKHADYVDARGASMTEKMLELTAPQPGERVLELACGAGGVGLAAAERVAPGGEVVLSDVAAEMTAIAAARAGALGLSNVSTRELDLEQIDQPDESYDVVICREGFMFATDPARAAREIRRVLRPACRAALTVWGPRERNPWLGVVFDTLSAQLARRCLRPAFRARSHLRMRTSSPACSRTPGWSTSASASSRHPCARTLSSSGGQGHRRLRDHWQHCWRRCPRTPRSHFAATSKRRSVHIGRPPDWSSPASPWSPEHAARNNFFDVSPPAKRQRPPAPGGSRRKSPSDTMSHPRGSRLKRASSIGSFREAPRVPNGERRAT